VHFSAILATLEKSGIFPRIEKASAEKSIVAFQKRSTLSPPHRGNFCCLERGGAKKFVPGKCIRMHIGDVWMFRGMTLHIVFMSSMRYTSTLIGSFQKTSIPPPQRK
jgi:hypothetical protein